MSEARVRVQFEDGQPCLQIVDADSCCVRMAWKAPSDHEPLDRLGLRDFFRECLLVQARASWWADDDRPRN